MCGRSKNPWEDKEMINIKNPACCCGCSACQQICPKNAITMIPDTLGFLYPKVDLEKCIDCKLCERVCSFNDNYETLDCFDKPIAYGCIIKDDAERAKSQSGGAFTALSSAILDVKGTIYGAGYLDKYHIGHKRAANRVERDELRQSKYVQSDVNDCFRMVKKDLKDGLTVLFSGTACQIAGLKSYLKLSRIETQNLYTVDIICHGVPSPRFWKDFLAFKEKERQQKIKTFNFRDKSIAGWHAHIESFAWEDGTKTSSREYTRIFYLSVMNRKSCSNCYFTNLQHPSDITIADFWGVEKQDVNFGSDNKGASLVLINTPKGKDLFQRVENCFDCIEAKQEAFMQPNMMHPTYEHPDRDFFEKAYAKKGFEYVYKKYRAPKKTEVLLEYINASRKYLKEKGAGFVLRKILKKMGLVK